MGGWVWVCTCYSIIQRADGHVNKHWSRSPSLPILYTLLFNTLYIFLSASRLLRPAQVPVPTNIIHLIILYPVHISLCQPPPAPSPGPRPYQYYTPYYSIPCTYFSLPAASCAQPRSPSLPILYTLLFYTLYIFLSASRLLRPAQVPVPTNIIHLIIQYPVHISLCQPPPAPSPGPRPYQYYTPYYSIPCTYFSLPAASCAQPRSPSLPILYTLLFYTLYIFLSASRLLRPAQVPVPTNIIHLIIQYPVHISLCQPPPAPSPGPRPYQYYTPYYSIPCTYFSLPAASCAQPRSPSLPILYTLLFNTLYIFLSASRLLRPAQVPVATNIIHLIILYPVHISLCQPPPAPSPGPRPYQYYTPYYSIPCTYFSLPAASCAQPAAVEHAVLHGQKDGSEYRAGDKLTMQCRPGYILDDSDDYQYDYDYNVITVDSMTITCLEGNTWTGTFPRCTGNYRNYS